VFPLFSHLISDAAKIVAITELVQVEQEGNAIIECLVDANPATERTITWKARSKSNFSLSSTGESQANYVEIDQTRMRVIVELVQQNDATQDEKVITTKLFSSLTPAQRKSVKVKSSLVIYNVSIEDSASSFDCFANNGINGTSDVATSTLLVLRK